MAGVTDREERYSFSWAGKRAAATLVDAPPIARLIGDPGGPAGDLATGHLFVEGDNLEALKLLRPSQADRVKLVYIDPPYNTGSADLPYADSFGGGAGTRTGRSPGQGLLSKGLPVGIARTGTADPPGTADRAHAAWLSLLYPRLILARRLLRADGLIAVSIDDHEVHRLRLLLDEVFGEGNFVAQITVQSNPRGRQAERFLATVHEYLLIYAKDADRIQIGGFALTEDQVREFKHQDATGRRYRLLGLRQRGSASRREDRPRLFYPIFVDPDSGRISVDPDPAFPIAVLPRKSTGADGRWMWSAEKVRAEIDRVEARLIARRGEWDVFVRDYLDLAAGDRRRRKARTIWDDPAFNYQHGTRELKALIGADVYRYPKPVALIRHVIDLAGDPEATVLDFFAGSATTAQAVLEANRSDGGRRRFVCVQSADPTGYPAYPTIADVARERIRRVLARLNAAGPGSVNPGCRPTDNGVTFLKVSGLADSDSAPP